MVGLFQIFSEEFLDGIEGNDVFLVVEVSVARSGDYHKELVVVLTGSDGQFLVGIAPEIEGVRLFSVNYHDGVLNLSGTAHQREVDPWNDGCGVTSTVGVE